jgi:hypothetical protein
MPVQPHAPKSTAISGVGQFIWAQVYSVVNKETPLDSSHWRRRTNAIKEITRGRRKLEPITPSLKGKGLHTLLFLMRTFPHGVLDTSAESIPNFGTKNKVLTHFLATLMQFSARFRSGTWIGRRNFETFGVRLFRAG